MAFKDRQTFSDDEVALSPDIVYDSVDIERPEADFRTDNVVKHYGETNKLKYPNITLYIEELKSYQVKVLAGLLKKQSYLSDDDDLVIYLDIKGELIEAGLIERKLLRRFLDNKVFGVTRIVANLTEDSQYEGDMLFAICSLTD